MGFRLGGGGGASMGHMKFSSWVVLMCARKKGEGRLWGKAGVAYLPSASNKVKVRGP